MEIFIASSARVRDALTMVGEAITTVERDRCRMLLYCNYLTIACDNCLKDKCHGLRDTRHGERFKDPGTCSNKHGI